MKKIVIMLPIIVLLFATACSTQTMQIEPSDYVFIWGNRSNCEDPSSFMEMGEVSNATRHAAWQDSTYAFITVEEHPVITKRSVPMFTAVNQEQMRSDHDYFYNAMKAEAIKISPSSRGADVFTALTMAAQHLENIGEGREKTVVVFDNLIPTHGEFFFDDDNVHSLFAGDGASIRRNTEETINWLLERNIIPNLQGVRLMIAGCGQTTLPQPPLTSNQKQLLQDFWEQVFQAAGASEIMFISGQTGKAAKSDFPVPIINFPIEDSITFPPKGIILDESCVRFLPDQAILADLEAAVNAITPAAEIMLQNKGIKALIVGTTAGDINTEFSFTLSHDRAIAVQKILISLGVDADRVQQIQAMGIENPWHLPGLGTGLEAAENRRVVILDANSDHAKAILNGTWKEVMP